MANYNKSINSEDDLIGLKTSSSNDSLHKHGPIFSLLNKYKRKGTDLSNSSKTSLATNETSNTTKVKEMNNYFDDVISDMSDFILDNDDNMSEIYLDASFNSSIDNDDLSSNSSIIIINDDEDENDVLSFEKEKTKITR
jgi:hypothetical protein